MSVPTASIACVFAALLATGCAVGPNYQRPATPAPAAFMGWGAVAARQAPAARADAAWWAGFGDPVLSDLIKQALDQNLDLAQAIARVSRAKAGLRAADAALLPSGSLSGQATAAHASVETPTGRLLAVRPGFDRDGEFYEANLGASWELDLFGGRRRERDAAKAGYVASQAEVAGARLSVAAQVADTYISIRGLQARIAVANAQILTRRRLVETVNLQFQKGAAAELQLQQAEGALAQVEATLPVLATGLDGALNALDVLLGAQPGTYRAQLAAPNAIPRAPAITDVGAPADLLRRRPDLVAAEQKLIASNAQVGAAISEFYPKFELSGLLGTATTTAGNVFTGSASQAQGVFGLRWRLFDFGRVDAEIAEARGAKAESLAAYRLAVLRASEDVEDAFSALVEREAEERTLAKGEGSLTRAQQSSLAAYKGGVVSLIEVLDADSRLLATQDSRAQAQTEAARAAVASFRALGGGWDSERQLASRDVATTPRVRNGQP